MENTNFIFQQLEKQHIESMYNLHHSIYTEMHSKENTKQFLFKKEKEDFWELIKKGSVIVGCFDNEKLVAFAVAEPLTENDIKEGHEYYIAESNITENKNIYSYGSVVVNNNYRGKRIPSKIISNIETLLKEKDKTKNVLLVASCAINNNASLKSLQNGANFEILKNYISPEDGEHCYLLTKQIINKNKLLQDNEELKEEHDIFSQIIELFSKKQSQQVA